MQTLRQLVEGLVKSRGVDYVILSLTNAGGSSRVRGLSEFFNEDQIDALEETCVICEQRNLPEAIRTPEGLQFQMDFHGITLVTMHWTVIRSDGTTMDYDIDDTRVF